jgi:hypothetical protein
MFETGSQHKLSNRNYRENEYLVGSDYNINTGTYQQYDYRKDQLMSLVPWTVTSALCVLIGIACIFVAFFVPSQMNDQWAWIIPSIVLMCLGATVLLSLGFVLCCVRNTADVYENWLAQGHLIYWRKEEFTDDVWNRWIEEEYGDRGRSRTKFDAKWFIIRIIAWIFISGFCSGMAALRLLLNGDEAANFGVLSFGAFVGILGVSVGTFVVLLMIVAVEINFCRLRSIALKGPYDFIADDTAYLWMNRYMYTGTGPCCITSRAQLEDRRVNLYHGIKHPCVEICISTQGRYGKNYFFNRIPIPPNKMQDAENFAQPGPGRATCWNALQGYAAEVVNTPRNKF